MKCKIKVTFFNAQSNIKSNFFLTKRDRNKTWFLKKQNWRPTMNIIMPPLPPLPPLRWPIYAMLSLSKMDTIYNITPTVVKQCCAGVPLSMRVFKNFLWNAGNVGFVPSLPTYSILMMVMYSRVVVVQQTHQWSQGLMWWWWWNGETQKLTTRVGLYCTRYGTAHRWRTICGLRVINIPGTACIIILCGCHFNGNFMGPLWTIDVSAFILCNACTFEIGVVRRFDRGPFHLYLFYFSHVCFSRLSFCLCLLHICGEAIGPALSFTFSCSI